MKKSISIAAVLVLALGLTGCDKEETYESGPRVEPERLNVKPDAADQAGGRTPTPQQLGNTNDKAEKPMDFGPIKKLFGLDKDKCGCECKQSSAPTPAPAPAPSK